MPLHSALDGKDIHDANTEKRRTMRKAIVVGLAFGLLVLASNLYTIDIYPDDSLHAEGVILVILPMCAMQTKAKKKDISATLHVRIGIAFKKSYKKK